MDSIWAYTSENWGVERAHRYAGKIIARLDELAAYPERGQVPAFLGEKP